MKGSSPLSHGEHLRLLGLSEAVSLDLEGGDSFVSAIGAVRLDRAEPFSIEHRKVIASSDLKSVDAYCDGARWIIGHNVIGHDLEVLARLDPDLALLRLKPIDTLYLSPLAFPRNPYHQLIKHYKIPGLARHQKNDPLLDAGTTLELLADACSAFAQMDPELLSSWHWLMSRSPEHAGFDDLFSLIRRAPAPDDDKARHAILSQFSKYGCSTRAREITDSKTDPLSLAWLLGWLPVAGGNSTIPPYVLHRAPEVHALARELRSSKCSDPSCSWCSSAPALEEDLSRFFGVGSFRDEPSAPDRGSLQRLLVEEQLSGQSILGIMPTGSGKSIAYQLPALLRHEQVGELTVVIMPLLSLMTDQVSGLKGKGVSCIDTINGLLSYPERTAVLKRVRLGNTGILLIAPEQLRNRSVRHALEHRVIGAWVFDEVHCLSKWGHDFRPDYRYAARFIRQHAGRAPIPPILGLTATAKRDVIDEIRGHFQDRLGLEMKVFNAGVRRDNLDFQFLESTKMTRLDLVASAIEHDLPEGAPGGALVYCVSRADTEHLAEALRARGIPAEHYHAKVPPTRKKEVQERFVNGELRVVVATNAFGMGIDKSDVRLVVHAGIPGSIENYLQEAGRAGRDGAPARCVLLFDPEDIERQFNLAATLELAQVELQAALRILRSHGDRVRKRTDEDGTVRIYVTPGEILLGDRDGEIQRPHDGPDTRIRTAIAVLEEAGLVFREENLVSIYPSSLKVASVADADERLGTAVRTQRLRPDFRAPCLGIVNALLNADPDEGISTDFLAASCGLAPTALRDAFTTLEHLGIASNDLSITAFVHAGVQRSSRACLESMAQLEKGLIDDLRELDPDDEALAERPVPVRLRAISQRLRDQGLDDPIPATLRLLLRALEHDRADDENDRGSVEVRGSGLDIVHLRLLRPWRELDAVAARRRDAAAVLLGHLLDRLPRGTRGTDLLVDTTYGALQDALRNDAVMASHLARSADPRSVLDRALLWLHQIEAIVLHQGLTVFRQAMTIRVPKNEPKRSFTADDYRDLEQFYESKTAQIHATEHFAEIGLSDPSRALAYAEEYFDLVSDEFLRRWFPGRQQEVKRRTRSENYERIVTALGSREQEEAVTSDRKRRPNLLVLAGPGSGKTRMLVHRIAWLIKVKRVAPQSILALAYNRHAAAEIRGRLARLVGDDAGFVRAMTCHALAMRVLGFDLAGDHHVPPGSNFFKQILVRAVKLLSGDEEEATDTSLTWDGLLSGIRWILIDEYQDIGEPEYDLISALARRTQAEEDGAKPILFAVGDDDQNIYAFKGASIRYIRQFKSDYGARIHYLVENYRSTRHIVAASQALIACDRTRLKQDVTLSVDAARSADPPGGAVRGDRPDREGAGSDPVCWRYGGCASRGSSRRALASLGAGPRVALGPGGHHRPCLGGSCSGSPCVPSSSSEARGWLRAKRPGEPVAPSRDARGGLRARAGNRGRLGETRVCRVSSRFTGSGGRVDVHGSPGAQRVPRRAAGRRALRLALRSRVAGGVVARGSPGATLASPYRGSLGEGA